MGTEPTSTASRASKGKYTPNLNYAPTRDKTLAKIKAACGWAFATCHKHETVISKQKINKKLGRSNDDLGNFLRNQLLLCTDSHVRFGVAGEKGCAKKYILNENGYKSLMALLDDGQPLNNAAPSLAHSKTRECVDAFLNNTRKEYAPELKTLKFKMEQKGECPRLFHDLQYMRKEIKSLFWKETLPFNYDIQSCAPTLIYQQARQFGMEDDCAAIDALLADPKRFRQELADRIGIPYKQAKVIINALFCGAILGRGSRFELFRVIGYSYPKMNALREDVWLAALREEIKACWRAIGNSGALVRKRDKRDRLIPLSCDAKWHYYFQLERLVLEEIMDYLKAQGVDFFPEHDGFRACVAVDTQAIERQVSGALGFDIKVVREDHAPDSVAVVGRPVLSRPAGCSYAQATDDTSRTEDDTPDNLILTTPLSYDSDSGGKRACEVAMNPR